jgi:hypothetical protein
MSNDWRKHPHLVKRLHPDHPDDVQVLVHDGGPRLTPHRPELVWGRVLSVAADVFEAEILNQPQQLASVGRGDRVKFVVPASGEYAVMVTSKYLTERPAWVIGPCTNCGFSELLDAPSDLIAKVFPNREEGDVVEVFTSFCAVCDGVQTVQSVDFSPDDSEDPPTDGGSRKWWQFWK